MAAAEAQDSIPDDHLIRDPVNVQGKPYRALGPLRWSH